MNHGRLALGTVQFGMDYGIANQLGRIPPEEANKLVAQAKIYGIRTIDTGRSYGTSEECLGNIGVKTWDVITKVPRLEGLELRQSLDSWFQHQLKKSLQALKRSHLYGLLIHHASDLLSESGEKLFDLMLAAKNDGFVKKIGVSVYSPEELEAVFNRFPLELVQLPFSIFDQRFFTSGWLQRLKAAEVEIHSRSVFLQGLLLLPAEARPKKFLRWRKIWEEWDDWILETNLDPQRACLSAALIRDEIDRIVIGFDNIHQLEEICRIDPKTDFSGPTFDVNLPEDLINPVRWSNL